MFRLSCLNCPVRVDLFRLTCPGWPVQTDLSWLTCPDWSVSTVLLKLFCPVLSCPQWPVLVVMFSGHSDLILPGFLSWLSCLGCSAPAVKTWLSDSGHLLSVLSRLTGLGLLVRLTCTDWPVLVILYKVASHGHHDSIVPHWLLYSGFPVSVVLSYLSCHVLVVLSSLSCRSCPYLSVCFGCHVPAVLENKKRCVPKNSSVDWPLSSEF
jgi:hypothetical protein